MGHIRSRGCRDLLVYCTSNFCSHRARMNADFLADDTVLLALEPRMVCTGRTGRLTRESAAWVGRIDEPSMPVVFFLHWSAPIAPCSQAPPRYP